MKKSMLIILSIIFLNCIFSIAVKAEENILSRILTPVGQLSPQSNELIQQKITELKDKLNLSDEQKQKANILKIKSSKTSHVYKSMYKDEKNKLMDINIKGSNTKKIYKQRMNIKSLHSAMDINYENNLHEFEALLTPEQQTVFSQFKVDLQQIKEKELKNKKDVLKGLEKAKGLFFYANILMF